MGSVLVSPGLSSTGSAAVVHGLGRSTARGIFLNQGPNLCLLHWQEDSFALNHQGSPGLAVLHITCHRMSL